MKEFEISLVDLRIYAFHGVEPQENKTGNEFSVTIRLNFPFEGDEIKDNLSLSISYADIYEIVREEMAKPKKLLETVALSIHSRLTSRYGFITSGIISISKINPPLAGITGKAEVSLKF